MIEAEYGEWLARGQAHQQAARPIDAMLCYRQALKSNRNAVQVQFQLGEVLRELGRREEAVAAFRTALTWQPKHLSSLVALAGMRWGSTPLIRKPGIIWVQPCITRTVLPTPRARTTVR